MKDRVHERLLHMRDFAREALALTKGKSRDDLDSDRLLQLACDRLIELIGEAATHAPQALRDAHPSIPWRNMIGMRNWLIHGYVAIDRDLMWSTIQNDLGPLIAALDELLANWTGEMSGQTESGDEGAKS